MTVARMRLEMSQAEFVRWNVYFGRKSQAAQLAAARKIEGRVGR